MPRLLGRAFLSIALTASAAGAQPAPPRPAAKTLAPPRGAKAPVDARGFIRRWLVLEPVPVAGALTETAVNDAVRSAALPGPADALPRDGDAVTIAGTPLRWHALETRLYNLNLYHFAWPLSKPTSNVLFWVTTVVDVPREMHGVRLAIGSNSASRWWLDGELLVALDGDRQTVIDDGVSRRLSLRAGRSVIRAAVVNGGGATDFCARFLDAQDAPVTALAVSLR